MSQIILWNVWNVWMEISNLFKLHEHYFLSMFHSNIPNSRKCIFHAYWDSEHWADDSIKWLIATKKKNDFTFATSFEHFNDILCGMCKMIDKYLRIESANCKRHVVEVFHKFCQCTSDSIQRKGAINLAIQFGINALDESNYMEKQSECQWTLNILTLFVNYYHYFNSLMCLSQRHQCT